MLNCALAGCLEFDIVMATTSMASGNPSELHPLERLAIATAQPARSREFAAGRNAARKAMAYFGLGDIEIPSSPDRCPVWPKGVVGSISHSRHFATAAVTRDKRLAGIGIDIEEPWVDNARDIVTRVLTAREISILKTLPDERVEQRLARVACCKEAAYKAVYPIVGEYFDFPDIEIDFERDLRTFYVRPGAELKSAHALRQGRGWIGSTSGQLVSIFVIGDEQLNETNYASRVH